MSSLPEDDLIHIWRKMGENKDWSNFIKTVMGHCGRTVQMDSLLVDYLVREAYDLNKINFKFPEDPGGLYQVLNARIGHS